MVIEWFQRIYQPIPNPANPNKQEPFFTEHDLTESSGLCSNTLRKVRGHPNDARWKDEKITEGLLRVSGVRDKAIKHMHERQAVSMPSGYHYWGQVTRLKKEPDLIPLTFIYHPNSSYYCLPTAISHNLLMSWS